MPELLHDGSLWIAKGASRKEMSWKNTELRWSELVDLLQDSTRTRESYKEYMASTKPVQDSIKDVGGFVGGIINSGRRKKENIGLRQLLTLDVDNGNLDFWDSFTLGFDAAACIYTTHKHSARTPRYRLVIPLDREVHGDEYEAIARKLGQELGMALLDNTTFQTERLMYWPSTARDGEYTCQWQDGAWLSADEVLAQYRDWRDLSQWPRHPAETERINRELKKQEDPLVKTNIVGAFCQTYSISEVIDKYLSAEYIRCDVEDRYSYAFGSTAQGLVVYEDKWAYSHHSTDPASGELCNAFDLVRLHKFKDFDARATPHTPGNHLPSYLKMVEFCKEDAPVKILDLKFQEDKRDKPEDVFGEEPEAEPDDTWKVGLQTDTKNRPLGTAPNILLILNNDIKLKGCFGFNEFEQREYALRNLPWRKTTGNRGQLIDKDDACLRTYIERRYGISSGQKVKDALDEVMLQNRFHPVRDYLGSLEWDGDNRLDTLLVDYFGAEDSLYMQAITRKTFVAAVARVYVPGIKFDTMLVMVGKQGVGKSTLVRKLGRYWFSDSMGALHSRESVEQLQGVWLMEVAELAGFKKADVDAVKHFVAKSEDRFRVAYGKRTDNFPRQCVFVGTTNKFDFMVDQTGGRRFWPAELGVHEPKLSTFKDLTDTEIDQIWAEAVWRFKKNEPLHLDSSVEVMARGVQRLHTERDDRELSVLNYLEMLVPSEWNNLDLSERRRYVDEYDGVSLKPGTADFIKFLTDKIPRNTISVLDIWCERFGGTPKDGNFITKFIKDIMNGLPDWEKRVVRTHHDKVQRGYSRKLSSVQISDDDL